MLAHTFPLFMRPAHDRAPTGWISAGELVAVISVEDGIVDVWKGNICARSLSEAGFEAFSPDEPETVSVRIVGSDRELKMSIHDPHLVKREEAEVLKHDECACAWFEGVHLPDQSALIAAMLRKTLSP